MPQEKHRRNKKLGLGFQVRRDVLAFCHHAFFLPTETALDVSDGRFVVTACILREMVATDLHGLGVSDAPESIDTVLLLP